MTGTSKRSKPRLTDEEKTKRREYQRQYRQRNQGKPSDEAKAKKREYDRKYNADNKAHKLELNKKWRESNKDRYNAYQHSYHADNKERRNERTREWHKANPDKARNTKLKNKYGITLDEFNAMLSEQGGVCAICREPNTSKRDWHVDHCHSSGSVRGVLCHHCNTMLGLARDNSNILSSAISYLENFTNGSAKQEAHEG